MDEFDKRTIAAPSLLMAADELRTAAARPSAPGADTRMALRHAVLAVEHQLGGGRTGALGDLAMMEPRLIPRLERIEAGLAAALVVLWKTSADRTLPAGLPRRLEGLANEILEVLHESVRPIGSG